MKSLFILLITCILFSTLSCSNPRVETINIPITNLPPELKDLKLYRVVYDENNNSVMVAVSDNKINSVTTNEKHPQTTIMVDVSKDKVIFESDSVIVLKKN